MIGGDGKKKEAKLLGASSQQPLLLVMYRELGQPGF